MMLCYYPWSEKVLNYCLCAHDRGEAPTLDLELTSKCSHGACIYCDSISRLNAENENLPGEEDVRKLLQQGKSLGLRWVYTCGVGEPLEDQRLRLLVETGVDLGIRVSLFTNGLYLDRYGAGWLRRKGVCLILKLDSFEASTFDTILGRSGASLGVYRALDALLAAGYGVDDIPGMSDLALSIVPTALNAAHIPRVVEFAKAHNLFPSVGELEHAGKALEKNISTSLSLTEEEIFRIKSDVEGLLWPGYTRPLCPAIITGIHVDSRGRCVVDAATGLNCKWFLLEEGAVKILGDVRRDSLRTLLRRVRSFRAGRFAADDEKLRLCSAVDYVFGGCGGNPKTIMKIAKEHLGAGGGERSSSVRRAAGT